MGIVNAAVWFGAAIFFTAVVAPAVFSPETAALFGGNPETSRFYAGGVALILFERYFTLQVVCGTVALVHLLLERMYLGRKIAMWVRVLVMALLVLSLVGDYWVQPKMHDLRHSMYAAPTPALREQARRAFGAWHGVAQTVNLIALGGLLVYLLRASRSAEPGRYGAFYQIP